MNMEKEYIQKLLDSYMAAETTQDEEALLADYFCTHRDVPAEWRNFSILFRGLRQGKPKPVPLHQNNMLRWSAAAAVVIMAMGAGVLFMNKEEIINLSSEYPAMSAIFIPKVFGNHLNS